MAKQASAKQAVFISNDLHKRMKAMKAKHGIPINYLTKTAIEKELQRIETKA